MNEPAAPKMDFIRVLWRAGEMTEAEAVEAIMATLPGGLTELGARGILAHPDSATCRYSRAFRWPR